MSKRKGKNRERNRHGGADGGAVSGGGEENLAENSVAPHEVDLTGGAPTFADDTCPYCGESETLHDEWVDPETRMADCIDLLRRFLAVARQIQSDRQPPFAPLPWVPPGPIPYPIPNVWYGTKTIHPGENE